MNTDVKAKGFEGCRILLAKKGFIEIRALFEPGPSGETGTFRMEVEDTGCGISEADLKKLARPFVQLGAVSAQRGGTGLGLHICRLLARAMGGEMEIKSTLGKGTTFSIVVPNVKSSPLPSPSPSSSSSSSSSPSPSPQPRGS